MSTILVVDDEEKILDVVASYLKAEGYNTYVATTGYEALSFIERQRIDLMILDLMLPDLSGEEVCRAVRQISSLPVLMLTAKSSDISRLNGFSIGADDYITKPFDPREVVARVRAILRRTESDQLLSDILEFNNGYLVIDSLKRIVQIEGESVNLTPNEYKLLIALAKSPQRHYTREELIDRVWGYEYDGDLRTVDQHIKNIRQKIEPDPKNPIYILTVYGSGYRFAGGRQS